MQSDMQRILGEQHFQTVSEVAANINDDVLERLNALEVVAETLAPVLPRGAALTQKTLDNLPIFQRLFNSGSFVTGMDGTAIAAFPISNGWVGVNFMDRDYLGVALKEGRSSVSKPLIGKLLNTPVIAMVVPIRDPQGQVIGALSGVIDLSKSNFLDRVTKQSFNKTGAVSIVAPQHRITVMSSDKRLIMFALPPPGVNPYLNP